jgi:hypothetical protein
MREYAEPGIARILGTGWGIRAPNNAEVVR